VAVAFDATSGGAATSDTNTLTVSHTASGTDRYALAFVAYRQLNSATVSGVTYNGVAMTRLGGGLGSDSEYGDLWEIVNPPTGAQSVVATLSANSRGLTLRVITFTGVHQTTPSRNFNTATGISTAPSVTITSASTDLVLGALVHRDAGTNVSAQGSGQTSRWNQLPDSYTAFSGSARSHGSTEPGAASVVMDWTISSSQGWRASGVSIQEAGGAAPTTSLPYRANPLRTLLLR